MSWPDPGPIRAAIGLTLATLMSDTAVEARVRTEAECRKAPFPWGNGPS